MFRKVLGSILILVGAPMALYYALWPLSGSHGATWLQFLPPIAFSAGLAVIGVLILKLKSTPKEEVTNEKNEDSI